MTPTCWPTSSRRSGARLAPWLAALAVLIAVVWMTRRYKTGLVVTPAEMRALDLHPHLFHGDWNYELRPRPT